MTACVFLTNVPFHRALNDRPHIALAPSGLGIPDFNRPGFYRLSEVYRQKRKHIDAHDIAAAFIKYPQFPPTFDGSLPSESLDGNPRVIIGETYVFDGVRNLSGSTEDNLVGTVTTATVLESEKRIYIGVTDQNGRPAFCSSR